MTITLHSGFRDVEPAKRKLVSCPQAHAADRNRAGCIEASGIKVLTENRPIQSKRPQDAHATSNPLVGPMLQRAYGQPVTESLPNSMTVLLAKLRY